MKSDIDVLMQKRNLSAIIVFGNAEHNPPMTYLTGGGHVTGATLIKKIGSDPVLFCGGMERDEAAKSNFKVRLYDEFPWIDLFKEANGDTAKANAIRLMKICTALGIAGRVGFYGFSDLSGAIAMFKHFQTMMSSIDLVGEPREDSLFLYAMETKEENEVLRIRKMGKITTEVVGLTADYLTNCQVSSDECLLKEDGSHLKLGDVKSKINLWLAERGAVPSEGFIFSIGRDSGVPHSQGNPDDLMRLGQTIVFDIYPQEPGGGFFYDFTRTWSLGYATPKAQELYDHVLIAYNKIIASLKINTVFKEYQTMVCEIFESFGHPTQRTDPAPLDGYIHSLGHGVGLNIHERPFSGFTASDDQILKPGVVMTIEPGLYYPGQGMGVRIEDTYWITPEGRIELLAAYPYDFVLKMKKWTQREPESL